MLCMSHTPHSRCRAGLVASLVVLACSHFVGAAPASHAFDTLLARYDREPEGAARDRLAAKVDRAAHQKYATVSRLYWHTDLASAKAAAHESRQPILHLRMLGSLSDDLSCANSRLFRATLYANREVSAFLRENFVLYWSSERPVPRVTIDYGDGRRLERTTTGNSAHYVLDEDGHVLDVLPGLYAPTVFRKELEASLALAARVRGTAAGERARLLVTHHRQIVAGARREMEVLAARPGFAGVLQLLPASALQPLAAAQRTTVTKSIIEVPDLRRIARDFTLPVLSDGQVEMMSAAGQVLYDIGRRSDATGPDVLDASSRALVIRLHNGVPRQLRATREQLESMLAGLGHTIVADTVLNELHVRPEIAREIVRRGGRIDFETLNAWVYDEVFNTPKQDAWLGLLPRSAFTGVAGDGVVLRSSQRSNVGFGQAGVEWPR